MEGISGVLGSIPSEAWIASAAATTLVLGIGFFPHARRAFHHWRLDQRLARNPVIQRDEFNDYSHHIDDDLAPLDGSRLVGGALVAGLVVGAQVAIFGTYLQELWDYAHWLLLVGGMFYAIWRWHNDPPELRSESAAQSAIDAFLGERDAVLGLGSAIVIVVLILIAAFTLL
jgi:hypothetical protein